MSQDNSFRSRDPVVRTETGTWCRIVDIDGLGLRRAVSFQREITWLRSASASAVLVNGKGATVDSGSTFCDVGEYLGCIGSALTNARAMASENEVGTGPFAVEVRLTVEDVPVIALPPGRWDTASSAPEWMRVPRDWIGHDDVAKVEAWLALDRDRRFEDTDSVRGLKQAAFISGEVVWDTRPSSPEREAAKRGTVDRALLGLPEDVAIAALRSLYEALPEPADA